ncbi:hypothetical protein PanWU01x14_116430 [Parasponia andersonii]|uniref:Uncharacterized protein n=1 Tax=Parasponia andersonii TaxID=3476 RepID=A0A2P5CWQ5_PARAD|nr:hypothetical protein PanWU01x14_116430 [Parasponia andersonii]
MAKENPPKKSEAMDSCMSLLRTLDHHQLLLVLSHGFCQNCEVHVEERVRSFFHTSEKACDDGSKGSADASWSLEKSKRIDLQEISPQNSIQKPDPINLPRKKVYTGSSLTPSLKNKIYPFGKDFSLVDDEFSEEEENIRISEMGRKDDFHCFERIDGKLTNVVEGLELHTRVFNAEE